MDQQYSADGSRGSSEEWKRVQAYGQYLGEAANHFPLSPNGSAYPPPISFHTIPPPDNTTPQTSLSSYISPFDWISWREFQFNNDFSQFAPLDAAQNRTYAQQSSNLSNWIVNPANETSFSGWQSLNQVPNPPPISDEAQQQQAETEFDSLRQVLTVQQDQNTTGAQIGEGTWQMGGHFSANQMQGPFAQYLLQDAPISSSSINEATVPIAIQQSWNPNTEMGEQDTRSVVPEDNHWRRTIFG
jgi:hypothetical protein